MKLIQQKAARIYQAAKSESNFNYFAAKQIMANYHDGKANENRTIKELSKVLERELFYVRIMGKILKKHFPECENPKMHACLDYIAQFI